MAVAPEVRGRADDFGERVVGIDWVITIPAEEGKTFSGAFANPNVVCKLRHGATLEFLRQQFRI